MMQEKLLLASNLWLAKLQKWYELKISTGNLLIHIGLRNRKFNLTPRKSKTIGFPLVEISFSRRSLSLLDYLSDSMGTLSNVCLGIISQENDCQFSQANSFYLSMHCPLMHSWTSPWFLDATYSLPRVTWEESVCWSIVQMRLECEHGSGRLSW